MNLITRPATAEDVESLAPRLRQEDVREVTTASGMAPEVTLLLSLALAFECFTYRTGSDTPPFAIFGVTDDPRHDGYGVVWFLGAQEVAQHPLAILTECQWWLQHWERRYLGGLHNVVDSRNLLHRRWLKLLDFEEGPTLDVHGIPFIYISRHAERSR